MRLINLFASLILINIAFQYDTSLANEVTYEQKADIKQKLKQLTAQARLDAISRAEVVEKKMDALHRNNPEKIAAMDMVQELRQTCGPNFNFINNENKKNVKWPKVRCKYHRAKKVLGGSTNKFLCDFSETNKKGEIIIKTRKVKYRAFTGIKNSELVPSLLSSSVARMIGFHTETYCPAIIHCENCPHNMPYEFGKSRGRPSGRTFEFRDAMVEMGTDLMTITPNTPRLHPRKPHGINWHEIFYIQATTSKSVRDLAIEREAWLLWLNFIVEMDAYSSNQKLACRKASLHGIDVYCDKPVMYTTDYGQSFFHRFQFEKWKNHISLIQEQNQNCRGGMTAEVMKKEKGRNFSDIPIGPLISSEARDFLISRLRNISDKQWIDILRIANTERLFDVTPDNFLLAIKSKIKTIEQTQCASFDSETTVLSSQLPK